MNCKAPLDPANALDGIFRRAFKEVTGLDRDPMVRPCKDPARGDYQINGCIPLAAELGIDPKNLAQAVLHAARVVEPPFGVSPQEKQ